VEITGAFFEGVHADGADFRQVRGMTRAQYDMAITDDTTVPPLYLLEVADEG